MKKEFIIKGDYKTQQDGKGDIKISVRKPDGRYKHDLIKVFFGSTQEEREGCLAYSYFIRESLNVFSLTDKTHGELLNNNKELLEALNKINQFSDPGDFAAAVIEMKAIAREAIKKATE